ncbi:hypothetical protein ABGB18_43485 [Nonomuraea sp. B12E4]|uniref:hypothetical protein n=1 Tax=Nonomuraea sp. B12E4 TaxID=3153564 RepID=UPI00325C59F6
MALPARGQGFSHLDQHVNALDKTTSFRPGKRTSATKEVAMSDRRFKPPAQPARVESRRAPEGRPM